MSIRCQEVSTRVPRQGSRERQSFQQMVLDIHVENELGPSHTHTQTAWKWITELKL